jgi:hypothetical protein
MSFEASTLSNHVTKSTVEHSELMSLPSEASSAAVDGPVARIILLGASNLTRGISTAVETARRIAGGPAEFHIAMGHGRSYGKPSRVLARTLPGVVECRLWDAVRRSREARGELPTYALVTDIGNDIAYGRDAATIRVWIDETVDRLLRIDARIAVTRLPLMNIERLTPWQYRLALALLFRGRGPTLAQVIERAGAVNDHLAGLAARHGLHVTTPQRDWYGADPVHHRRRLHAQVWRRSMAGWIDGPERRDDMEPVRGSLVRWLRTRWAVPEAITIAGLRYGLAQPAAKLPDGSTLSLF